MLDVRTTAPARARRAVEQPTDGGGAAPAGASAPGSALRAVLAIAAGLLLVAAFPPYDAWAAAPLSVGMLVLAVRGTGGREASLLGLAHGAAFFVPLLHWSGIYVGAAPWLILASSQALFHALLGGALAVVTRLPGWPLWAAAVWTGEEALRARVPYHGFPWGRLAFGLADSPYLHLAPLGGAPMLTFAAALTGALIAGALLTCRQRPAGALGRACAAVLATVAPLALPMPAPQGPPVTVALIQGNVPRLGLDFNSQRREVLRNHVLRTRELATRVRAGQVTRPDFVLWPENSSDIDPFRDPEAYQLIESAVRDIGVPVIVGALVEGPGRFLSNTAVVWDPRAGPGQRYVKRQPVPFAEYIPLRPLARRISAKVDLVRRDFAAGGNVGVLDVGGVRVGDLICFEVGDDDLVRDAAGAGTQVLAVQTNNATFGFTPQTEQQLAMSRVRAVEHGRPVLVAATSGVSAVIAPDGRVSSRAEVFTPAVLVASVATAQVPTPATRLAPVLEGGLATLGVLAAAAATLGSRRRRIPRGRGGEVGGVSERTAGLDDSADASTDASPDAFADLGRILIVTPTYEERPNLERTVARLRSALPEADVLVADDASPDGTGELADQLARADSHVHVLHRPGKDGLGAAYIAAFRWGLARGYDVLIEMDADGSHQPEQLPRLLAELRGADLVLGSRWVPGGEVHNWPRSRELLSRGANTYTRLLLGVPLHDATGGYRAFRRETLEGIDLDGVSSRGYCFQVDLAWRAVQRGFRVVETPVTFIERELGSSKMSGAIVREALWMITVWGVRQRGRQLLRRGRGEITAEAQ